MLSKQIVFTSPNTVELLERNVGSPNTNEVLVKLEYSTISSGTERANLSGEINVSVADNFAEAHFPRFCGYSSSGVVEAVGENVKSVKVGDRVALSWSTHSQYCLMPENSVHKIPFDDVSMQEAALAHIATFPLLAIRRCHLEIGESAIVMGLGILGMIAVQLLKAGGAYPVIVADPIEEKRKFALKNGADYAFNPFDTDFAQKVKSVCGGVNVAIEVTGNGKALDSVLDCMKKFGRVALLGCTRNSDFTIDYYHKVHGQGVSLIGAHTNSRPSVDSHNGGWTYHDDVMTFLSLIHGKRIDMKSLIAEVHSPNDAKAVYSRLLCESNFPVVQFDWKNFN